MMKSHRSLSALRGISLAFLAFCSLSFLAQSSHAQEKGKISGAATYALTRELLAAAPKRFNGSPGHAAAEKFIESHFAPEQADHRLDVDTFTASTPAGLQTMHNIIVRFPGKKDGYIVIGSHYETTTPPQRHQLRRSQRRRLHHRLPYRLGQYFRTHPPLGYSVVLVFFDGEEAVNKWSASDSLYGSRISPPNGPRKASSPGSRPSSSPT